MNIYLISQGENNDYDTFDSVVVIAASKEDAVKIHPYGSIFGEAGDLGADWNTSYSWVTDPSVVRAELIGVASEDALINSVVLSSFNAG